MGDPYINNVEILANFQGTDGQTTYTGEIGGPVTFVSTAQLDTAYKPFGDSSFYCPSGGRYGIFADAAAGDFDYLHDGTESYTIEAFVRWPGTPTFGAVLGTISNSTSGVGLYLQDNKTVNYYAVNDFVQVVFLTSAEDVISYNTWHYISVEYDHTTNEYSLKVDAVEVASDTQSPPSTPTACERLFIGRWQGQNARDIKGWIGPIRITRGVVRGITTVPTEIFSTDPETDGKMLVSYPLQNERLIGFNDFSAVVSGFSRPGVTIVRSQYYMQISGSPTLTIPISSWQATKQLDRTQYLQCVVPAVDDYVSVIAARQGVSNFTIYRTATLPSGFVHNVKVAESLLESVAFSEGGRNYSCTLSGYPDGVSAPTIPSTYELAGVRYITENSTGTYVARCAIDWLLRPGDLVTVGDISFTAAYVNYFANDRDSYMDVGSR